MSIIYNPRDGSGARRVLGRIGGANPIKALQEQAINGTGLFRAAAPLPPEAGEVMDSVVTEVGADRLAVVAALIEYVSRPLDDWWSTMTVQHEKISRQGRARATMKPGGRGARSTIDRTPVSTPIYAYEQDFDFHERFLAVANAAGVRVEDDSLRNALININELAEDFAINGPGVQFNAVSTVYGLETAPNKNTVSFSGSNPAWDHASKTGEEILDDVLAMRAANVADNHNGPCVLFHEPNYESPLDKPYSDGVTTNYGRTVRETILALNWILDVRVSDQISDDICYLVEMSPQTCGIFMGQDPTWLPLPVERFDHPFLALACMVPYFRDDYDGGSGICRGTV